MTSDTRVRLTLLWFLLVAATFALGCGGSATEELVIGEFGSLTGNDATFGQSTKNGVQVAIDELNAAKQGKIGGLKVRVVVEDDQGRAEEAATVVQKLINSDGVVAVLGEVASSRSLAAAPLCQNAGVPMITPSSTNPRVTQVGDYIFRMCFLDDFQGQVMAKFASGELKLTRVAVLKDIRQDYSVGLAQYFTEAFKQLGGTIVIEQSFSSGDQDFRAQLTAIKAKNPQAVILPIYYTEAGLIGRQARELGITVPLIGSDGWESEQLIQIGGEALNGCYYVNHWALDQPDPKLQEFLTKYRTAHKSDPDAIGGLAYDAANVLFASLERLAEQDPESFKGLSSKAGTEARRAATKKLRDLIATTTNYPGATGVITLDENRNASKPAVVIGIEGGKKVYKASISP
ncbi:MAG TPA: ABC transporter substrate-binding protein [Candidatus Limnocylindria bacterium]|nr:ABC transporter substrate-binding protein [Candidatus Limnocylindria bacterium]